MEPNKQEIKAISLVSSAVDGVLNESERDFFEQWLKKSALVNKLYKEQKLVRNLLKEKASEHVKLDESYKQMLLKRSIELAKIRELDENLAEKKPRSLQTKISYTILSIAAAFILVWLGNIFMEGSFTKEKSFEYFAAATFLDHNGTFVEPTWTMDSHPQAEQAIRKQFNYNVHVPEIMGADFMGVVEIKDELGNPIPMLEYCQKELNEYIYLFAFELSKPVQPARKRLKEAIFNCRTQTDYYVSELNGRHVVSWKWDDTWYSAVSNHNGNDLAALVGPLNNK